MREILEIYLHCGEVKSKVDGDIHYIGAENLAKLYDVPLNHPRVFRVEGRDRPKGHRCSSECIHLYPRYDGNYKSYRHYLEELG